MPERRSSRHEPQALLPEPLQVLPPERARCLGRRSRLAARAELGRRLAFVADYHDVRQYGNFVPVVEKYVQYRAGHLGGFFERGFVRLVGEQNVAYRDGVAFFLLESVRMQLSTD